MAIAAVAIPCFHIVEIFTVITFSGPSQRALQHRLLFFPETSITASSFTASPVAASACAPAPCAPDRTLLFDVPIPHSLHTPAQELTQSAPRPRFSPHVSRQTPLPSPTPCPSASAGNP